MLYTILFTLGFITVAFILLAIKIIIKKGGKFPNFHIGGNKALADKGITCALSTDAKDRKITSLKDRLNNTINTSN